ncbi:hypothetical protein GN956_G16554 [Arapaima gigas]
MDRFRPCVLSLLILCLLPFSGCISTTAYVVVQVGRIATLPCNWTRPDSMTTYSSSHPPHLQWQTLQETVLEVKGSQLFQASEYKDRANVPHDRITEGDCSLSIQEVRYSDAGLYESFIITGHKKKMRRFLQSILLTVIDHKSRQTLQAGDDFILSLHTSQAFMVVFHGSGDQEETVKWEQGGERNSKGHVEKSSGSLTFHSVNLRDSGIYRVLDPDGLVISTTILTVEEVFEEPLMEDEVFAALGADIEVYSDSNAASSSFATITVFLLYSSFIHFVL